MASDTSSDAIKQMSEFVEKVDEPLKKTFRTMHQGYVQQTLERFLKAREGNVAKAIKMLLDCLNWRVQNDIDNILAKPIEPREVYNAVRESQLMGMTGYCRLGRPVLAIGVGLSAYDKASADKYVQSHIQMNEYRDQVLSPNASKKQGRYIGPCLKVLDMTGLKLSALNRIKILTMISTVDDLNYPEKTETYYIVNAPYVFSACWKVVKPLLQERTRRKVQVLQGCGRDELLKVMDYDVLPHFSRQEGSGSSKRKKDQTIDCFSPDHPFHVELYNYIKQQAAIVKPLAPAKMSSFHVDVPEQDAEGTVIVHTIETALQKYGDEEGVENGVANLKLNGDHSLRTQGSGRKEIQG
uniref:TSA: Wollemia nobilis Ref_Wollemi_Transcript_10735_1390 transcribed RNA sequence n=1 Tax=Wollemia nobilis TaxID=56998 RepID=A0A0C9S8P7_9CONI